jgi:hypothetical protein
VVVRRLVWRLAGVLIAAQPACGRFGYQVVAPAPDDGGADARLEQSRDPRKEPPGQAKKEGADDAGAVESLDAGSADVEPSVDAGLSVPGTAIVVDFISEKNTGNGGAVSLSWTHTTGSGPNRLLLVGVSIRNGGGETVSGVTYGGASLTFVGAQTYMTSVRVEHWRLVNPASGDHTVVVMLTRSPTAAAGAVTFSGIDPDDPHGEPVGASGEAMPATLTVPSRAGDLVVDTVGLRAGFKMTPAPGQTQLWNVTVGPFESAAGSARPGEATVPLQWTTDNAQTWAIQALSLHAAP